MPCDELLLLSESWHLLATVRSSKSRFTVNLSLDMGEVVQSDVGSIGLPLGDTLESLKFQRAGTHHFDLKSGTEMGYTQNH